MKEDEREEFKQVVLKAFDIDELELAQLIGQLEYVEANNKIDAVHTIELHSLESFEQKLRELTRQSDFLSKYDELTSNTEPPLAFHLASVLAIAGACNRRKVSFRKGFYSVFPNLSVVLIGPPGSKKGAAISIARMLAPNGAISVLAEKLTPEVIVESLGKEEILNGVAAGLLYAPELSLLLGKQRYNEGMIPLINELVECKDTWSSATISRGEKQLNGIYFSLLGGTTVDLFLTSMPTAAQDGGLLSRLVLVPQENTERCVAFPTINDGLLAHLQQVLAEASKLQGEFKLAEDTEAFYGDWYKKLKASQNESNKIRAYRERKPDHVFRVAMIVHLLDHQNLILCLPCVQFAISFLDLLETQLPKVFSQLFDNKWQEQMEQVIRLVELNGGTLDHQTLVRKLKMDIKSFRTLVDTLKNGGVLKEISTQIEHYYVLKRRD